MTSQTVNRNLFWLREQRNLTQEEVATKIGIPRTTYLFYEGERMPPDDVLQELSKLYKLPIADLLEKDLMPEDYRKTYELRKKSRKKKGTAKIESPFPADDPDNWERAGAVAMKRKLALFMSMVYDLQGKSRSYDECLDDIDNDTTILYAEFRRKGRKER